MPRNSSTGRPDDILELHFTRTNGPADTAIDQIIGLVGGVRHPEIVREMILAALKAGQESATRGDLKLMNSTLKEMRFTTKIFGPYRGTRKVTVFGSARTKPHEPAYEMARLLGQRLVEGGYMVITGGGGGIMQAVNEGAGPEHSFGVNIRLPFEAQPNPVLEGNPRNISYKYFFNRKVAFLKEADAVVLLPGGFGTLDEAMETLTLVQTGKRNPMPLILVEEPEGTYWQKWIEFLQNELIPRGFISPMDVDIFEGVHSPEEAVARIDRFYRTYHSLRYVGEQLVIRLTEELDKKKVEDIKSRFSDILKSGGGLFPSSDLPEEADEPEISHLPRLVMDFNRRDFSKRKRLIDALNEE